MSASSVCWRGGDVRAPPVKSLKRSSRRRSISATDIERSARRRQLQRERDAVEAHTDRRDGAAVVGTQGETSLLARAPFPRTNGQTHTSSGHPGLVCADGTDIEGTRWTTSPTTPSGERLVASTLSRGASRNSIATAGGAGVEEMLAVVEHDEVDSRRQPGRHGRR